MARKCAVNPTYKNNVSSGSGGVRVFHQEILTKSYPFRQLKYLAD